MTRYEEAQAAGFPHRGLVFCHTCGGSYIEVGVSGGKEVPHSEGCPRNPSKEWRPEQQDREAAALRHLGAPVPVPDDYFHDPFECPDPTGDHCETPRRRVLTRILREAGQRSDGLRPKPETGEDL